MVEPVTQQRRAMLAKRAAPYLTLILAELEEGSMTRLCEDGATPLERMDARADLRTVRSIRADLETSVALGEDESNVR